MCNTNVLSLSHYMYQLKYYSDKDQNIIIKLKNNLSVQYIKAYVMCNTCIWRGMIGFALVLFSHIYIANIFKLFLEIQAIDNIDQNDICKAETDQISGHHLLLIFYV